MPGIRNQPPHETPQETPIVTPNTEENEQFRQEQTYQFLEGLVAWTYRTCLTCFEHKVAIAQFKARITTLRNNLQHMQTFNTHQGSIVNMQTQIESNEVVLKDFYKDLHEHLLICHIE